MGGSGWVVCAGDRGCLTATAMVGSSVSSCGASTGDGRMNWGGVGEVSRVRRASRERGRTEAGQEGEGRGEQLVACGDGRDWLGCWLYSR
jgi:hypothetical protein